MYQDSVARKPISPKRGSNLAYQGLKCTRQLDAAPKSTINNSKGIIEGLNLIHRAKWFITC